MLRSVIAKFVLVVVVVASSAVAIFADTVRLKDGSILKGRITSFTGGKFTIEIGEGQRKRQLAFDASEVQSIEFDLPGQPAFEPVRNTSQPPIQTREDVIARETTRVPEPKTPDPQKERTQNVPESRPPATSNAKPIELSVKVLADNTSNGWTNSGWVVRKGQRIRITGEGEISLGKGMTTAAGGLWNVEDDKKLLKAVPTGALIAVIGDDNNDFIYIGNDREFVAARDGALFLGINEGNLSDNSGALTVKIEIFPGG